MQKTGSELSTGRPRPDYATAVALADLESYRVAWDEAYAPPSRKVRVVREAAPKEDLPREVARGVRTDFRHGSTAMP